MHHRVFLSVLLLCLVARPVKADGPVSGGTAGTSSPHAVAACDAGCRDSGCDADCKPPTWSLAADALWLQRTPGSGAQLGRTFVAATGDTVDQLSSSDGDYAMQAGTRFRLLYHSNECTTWEAVYFGMQNWNNGSSVTPDLIGVGSLADSPYTQTDKLIGGFDTSLAFHSTSRLNNVEINFCRELASNDVAALRWLAGVRYVQWDESLALYGSNFLPAAFEEIDVACHNQLVGPQIGFELQRSWDRWQFCAEGKAGLMGNAFQQRRSNLNSSGVQPGAFPAITPIDDANHAGSAACVIDCSFLVSYPLAPHLQARGGYQLLYLGGLAQAPAQLGGFDNSGNVFLHGPAVGFELNW